MSDLKTGDRITTDEHRAEMHTLLTGDDKSVNTPEQGMIIHLLKRVAKLEARLTELEHRLDERD